MRRRSLAYSIFIFSCYILLCFKTVYAGEIITDPDPDDLAFGAEVLTDSSHAFQAVVLPDHFYRYIARPDGGDFRVFDAAGEPLTFTISDYDAEQQKTQMQQLPVFPIYGNTADELDGLSLRIERNLQGTIIDISEDGGKNAGAKIIAYIIDNSYSQGKDVQGRLTELKFDWHKPAYGFINNIRLEKSHDLKSWRQLGANESLSRLEYEGEEIGKPHIKVNGETDRYLRMSWESGQEFELTSVSALYQWSQSVREMHWQDIDKLVYLDNTDQDEFEYAGYRFDVNGRAPVQAFSLYRDGGNDMYRGQLYSRATGDSNWNFRGRFLQYRLQMSGGVVQSTPHQLPAVRDNEWLIKFDAPTKISESRLPVVRLAWYPEKLIFLAQGKPPYLLAYGNPNVAPAHTDLAPLLNGLSEEQRKEIYARTAVLSEPRELAGASVLVLPAEKFPWRTALLWLVLAAGVLIMAKMAISLLKQMDDKR